MKAFLIHLLGGMTVEESMESDKNSYDIGTYSVLLAMKNYADSMYGCEAKDWCDGMYRYIVAGMNRLEGKEEQ